MELSSIESQDYGIAVEKQAQRPYNLRKRKRSPASKDQKENEKLARSKIPRRAKKCLPILPAESKITKLNFI